MLYKKNPPAQQQSNFWPKKKINVGFVIWPHVTISFPQINISSNEDLILNH
jgi:hypothetical protein